MNSGAVQDEGSVYDAVQKHFDAEKLNASKLLRSMNGGRMPDPYTYQAYPKMLYKKEYFSTTDESLQHTYVKTVDSAEDEKAAGKEYFPSLAEAKTAFEADKKK